MTRIWRLSACCGRMRVSSRGGIGHGLPDGDSPFAAVLHGAAPQREAPGARVDPLQPGDGQAAALLLYDVEVAVLPGLELHSRPNLSRGSKPLSHQQPDCIRFVALPVMVLFCSASTPLGCCEELSHTVQMSECTWQRDRRRPSRVSSRSGCENQCSHQLRVSTKWHVSHAWDGSC